MEFIGSRSCYTHTHTVYIIFIANGRVLPLRAGEEEPETAGDTVQRLQDLWRPENNKHVCAYRLAVDVTWILRFVHIEVSERIGWKWKSPFY